MTLLLLKKKILQRKDLWEWTTSVLDAQRFLINNKHYKNSNAKQADWETCVCRAPPD